MTSTAAPTRADRRRSSPWGYHDNGGRDRRLDLLRGYALAAMAVNHFGLHQSYVHAVSGRSSFLISAAEAFLFISGFTLGYISLGRGTEAVTARLWSRTSVVYLATIGITFGLTAVALSTDLALWGEFAAGDWSSVWEWMAQVITLRTAFNGADILILYVLYLAAAVVALRLMTQGRSAVVFAVVVGLYALSQLAPPEATALGFASFRVLIPNAPLFFGGLLFGYHRHDIARWWSRVPGRAIVDALTLAGAVALGWLHVRGYGSLGWLGEWINGDELDAPLGRRETQMPLAAMAVVGLYLRAGWIVTDALWQPLRRGLGWFLLPLGEASLFTFTMHLVAIPLVINLPMWGGEDVGRLPATAWVALYLAVIWVAVRLRSVLLDWLRRGDPRRELIRRRGPAVVVAGLASLVLAASVAPSTSAGEWGDGTAEFEFDDEEFEDNFEIDDPDD